MNNIKWGNISALLRALSTAQNGGDEKKFREALLDALLPILPKILDDYDPWNNEGMERKAQKAHAYQAAERDLSDAYIRLRTILGALNAGEVPTAAQVWEHTEAKAQTLVKSHIQLQWALRDLLAQTRDLQDSEWDGGSFGEGGYTEQSPGLRNAIDTADALVGTDVTEQFPIADEPLNRRIQELEVALAEEKKKKQSKVFIGKNMLNIEQDGITRVQLGQPEVDRKWSEEALRLVIKKVMAEREAEIADKFQETQAQLDHMSDTIAAALRKNSTETATVTVDVTVPDIIEGECKPGGRIHAAIHQNGDNSR